MSGLHASPTLRTERRLLRERCTVLGAADEVGRGALCGPVTVGVVVITAQTRSAPSGVRDSKLLSASQREALVPRIRRWAAASAVGHATAPEIDRVGLTRALRIAAGRALAALTIAPDLVLLDGSHDYLSEPAQADLFDPDPSSTATPDVVTMIKGDLTCAAVAAASILAKCERDAIMRSLAADFPDYGWAANKGYSAPEHIDALVRQGPTPHHRVSWQLPGISSSSGR